MFISAVLDPTALSTGLDPEYLRQVKLMLRGMVENGVFLDDQQRRLQRRVSEYVRTLPTRHGQAICGCWEDLLKGACGKRVVTCVRSDLADLTRCAESKLPLQLYKRVSPDGLLARHSDENGVVDLSTFDDSDFERKRTFLREGIGAINQVPRGEVEEFLLRTIRFSRWLRIYDKHIGKTRNVSGFLRGIVYLVGLWYQHGFFATCDGGRVEILTTASDGSDLTEIAHHMSSQLYEKLAHRYCRVEFSIAVKDDVKKISHERYLESQQGAIQIGLGFDFLNRDGTFKATSLLPGGKEWHKHLDAYRGLPDKVRIPEPIR